MSSGVVVSGHLAAGAFRDGIPIAFTESERAALTRYGGLEEDGTIKLSLRGLPPRNEEDSDEVCKILTEALRAIGRGAEYLGSGIQEDDGVVVLDGIRLGIQVVSALISPEFWQGLARTQDSGDIRLTAAQGVAALKGAIELKTTIPPAQRGRLVLALDAHRLPALALGAVTQAFIEAQDKWARSLGFHSIYVVGPNPGFVTRLDP